MIIAEGDDDEAAAGYASPPCFMHELDPAYVGLADKRQHADVMRWRKAERQRLIDDRLTIKAEERREHAERVARGLDETIGEMAGQTIGVYWPFRGEADLRPWMDQVCARGGVCALPVVVGKNMPLVFRTWRQGERLERGVWNIPVPAEGVQVTPTIVIAPVVGFDSDCYRLGYGGGFFDRTLAGLSPRPRAIGVGYGRSAIPTIYPQPHDIPMTMIVTERGIFGRSDPQRDSERPQGR